VDSPRTGLPLFDSDADIEKRRVLTASTEPDELTDLRRALGHALRLPTGDAPPDPDADWRASWDRVVDLGVLGLCVPEEAGGFGRRADAAVAAARALGAALHGAPFPAMVAASTALAGGPDVATALLADVLADKRLCGFAALDPRTGLAHSVAGAADLDALVLVEPSGSLALVTDAAWSLRPSIHGGFDVTHDVGVLVGTAATRIPLPAAPIALPLYRLLLAADALGAVERSLERCVVHARSRTAFGRPIGGFQAVQHRLVDHSIRVRGMGLAVSRAATLITTADPGAARAVLVAEVAVARHSVHVLHDLLQLTGGIGFTWEQGLHLFERRAQRDAALAGNPRRALADLARTEGWSA